MIKVGKEKTQMLFCDAATGIKILGIWWLIKMFLSLGVVWIPFMWM